MMQVKITFKKISHGLNSREDYPMVQLEKQAPTKLQLPTFNPSSNRYVCSSTGTNCKNEIHRMEIMKLGL